MTDRCPFPARASFRDLLRDLVGSSIQVRNGSPQALSPDLPAYLAGYRFDDGAAAAVVVCDAALSAAAARALGAVSREDDDSGSSLEQGLDGDLLEFLHEVVNVAAKLLNSPTTPHVKLHELLRVPGDVPEDLATIAKEPGRREDWQVAVDGYGEGTLTLLG